jgi:hypothetical protein
MRSTGPEKPRPEKPRPEKPRPETPKQAKTFGQFAAAAVAFKQAAALAVYFFSRQISMLGC